MLSILTVPGPERMRRLFVYGSLLSGEADHRLLGDSQLIGPARTRPEFRLVDLNCYAGMIRGEVSVQGELYLVDIDQLLRIDVAREVPILFRRDSIQLAEGEPADTYLPRDPHAPGCRRLRHDDWRQRFAPPPRAARGLGLGRRH